MPRVKAVSWYFLLGLTFWNFSMFGENSKDDPGHSWHFSSTSADFKNEIYSINESVNFDYFVL